MTLTMADAEADVAEHCRACGVSTADGAQHAPDCEQVTGLGIARGDVLVLGERCSGPCRRPLEAGEHYQDRDDDGLWCLGCAATDAIGAV